MKNLREECLRKACECVNGQREQDYGAPEDNFSTIAELWTAYKGVEFNEIDVSMMMTLLKVARAKAGETKDSFVDMAGYAACAYEIAHYKNATKAEKKDNNEDKCNGCFGASMGDCATCDIPDLNCHEQCKEYRHG